MTHTPEMILSFIPLFVVMNTLLSILIYKCMTEIRDALNNSTEE